jgi:hypothetical protein
MISRGKVSRSWAPKQFDIRETEKHLCICTKTIETCSPERLRWNWTQDSEMGGCMQTLQSTLRSNPQIGAMTETPRFDLLGWCGDAIHGRFDLLGWCGDAIHGRSPRCPLFFLLVNLSVRYNGKNYQIFIKTASDIYKNSTTFWSIYILLFL